MSTTNTQVIRIDLVTEKGTFKFEAHHGSTADFIQALWLFEANNWEMLGDTSYVAYTKFEDGDVTKTEFSGINGSANLSEFIETL